MARLRKTRIRSRPGTTFPARESPAPPASSASCSNTSMNVSPINFAFFLRICAPHRARQLEEHRAGVDVVSGILKCDWNRSLTCSPSILAQQGGIDKNAEQAGRRWPECNSAATTEESTPPETPQSTRFLPTLFLDGPLSHGF